MEAERRRKIDELLEVQQGLVGRQQLHDEGWSEAEIDWFRGDARDVHAAVYVTGHAPLTNWQRWRAATLTEPETFLARWSVAAFHGAHTEREHEPIHIVRHGVSSRHRTRRGNGRLDCYDVRYSTVLAGDTEIVDGIPMTTLPRAVLDLCMAMSHAQRDRLFRDVIRLHRTTRDELEAIADAHRGHRGVGRLRTLLSTYAEIPIERTRSDAEVEGLMILQSAGLELPEVNVDVAGFEGDFVDFKRKRILELDGTSTHQFPERDAERERAWAAAGFTVQRRPTDDAYERRDSVLRGMQGLDEPRAA